MTPQRRAIERLSTKLALTVLFLLAVFFVAPVVWKYLSPFIVALPFATMIQPIARFLEKKLHLKHSPAVLIPVLLLLILMLTAVIWFLSYGVQQASKLLENPGDIVAGIMGTVRDALDQLLNPLDAYLANTESLNSSVDNAMRELTTWGTNVATELFASILLTATGVPNALIYINFLFMGLYFIAKDYDSLLSFLPHRRKDLSGTGAARLTHSAISGAVGYLKVQLIYGGLSLVVSAIYWTIWRNPYAIVIAVLAGILECVPLVGNGAIYLPWALVEVILGDYRNALLPLGIWLALYIIRRVTEPKLMAHNIGVSPLLSLVSMFAGYTAGGLPGMILGPVLMTVAVAFFHGGYLRSVKEDVSLLYRSIRRRWRDENLLLPPEEAAARLEQQPPAGEAAEHPARDGQDNDADPAGNRTSRTE